MFHDTDFDECLNDVDNDCGTISNSVASSCQNVDGSYSCDCDSGYSWDDNMSCIGKQINF